MAKIREDIESTKIGVLSFLLYPLSMVYGFVMAVRNYAYDKGYKKSYRFTTPIIVVGNLSVGGTGKTPTIEYLIRLLRGKYRLVTLSRGYGRETRGILFAGTGCKSARQLGDEPCQLYRKYGRHVDVVVGENRASAIRAITDKIADTSAILLDDAYQHRRVTPQFSILLTDFEKPFYSDYILPAGRLRESRKGAARADSIVVTKCPWNLSNRERSSISHRIMRYAGKKPIFFSYVAYDAPQPFWRSGPLNEKKVVLLSGIAKPEPFESHLKNHFEVLKHFRYPDHYSYTVADIEQIKRYLGNMKHSVALLTTEKDMVKLVNPKFDTVFSNLPCYYLPIEMVFDERAEEFDALVTGAIQKIKP